MMQNKSIVQQRFGSPKEALELITLPMTACSPDKIRVRIEAANINPSDLLSICGEGQYKRNHTPPRVPGFEGVGRVIASHNDDFCLGQKVLVATSGTWQQYVDLDPENLFKLPETLSNGYAAQLYINALTAWVMTTQVAKLTMKDVLIINAASSSIGKVFSQLSKTLGFGLIMVTSHPDSHKYGADYVISSKQDLKQQLEQRSIPTPNVAFDAIGGQAGMRLLQTLKATGRFIVYGTLSLEFYNDDFFQYQKSQHINFSSFFLRYWEDEVGKAKRASEFDKMLEHFLAHHIELAVDRCLPMEEFQLAIALAGNSDYLAKDKNKGKIILVMD